VKVYTRAGDDGSTSLGDGSRVSKANLRVAAYGDVDELNAIVGVLRGEGLPPEAAIELERIQSLLFDVGAFLADPRGKLALPEDVVNPEWAERWIDRMAGEVPALRNFVLPAGTRTAGLAHVARTVCRRAERSVVALSERGDQVGSVIPLLNRLSDAFFLLARWLNRRAGTPDVIWAARR
jgi:cob(I)alamin adenosyltransferase